MKKQSMLIMLLSLLILAACGSEGNEDNTSGGKTGVETNNENEEDSSKKEEAVFTDLGIYVGQADPHTVEIETTDGTKAFQLTEETAAKVDDFQKDDEIQFTYTVNDKEQNILQSIEKMSPSDTEEEEPEEENKTTESGIYNGQADPHTIEIETDDGPTAFQLSMEAREDVEELTVGEQVTYTYYEDGEQRVIESITEE